MLRRVLFVLAIMLISATVTSVAGDAQEAITGKKGDTLTALDQDNSQKAEALLVKMSRYMADCRAAGVPLPPVWGDARWQFKGLLPKDHSFDSSEPVTEVWTYSADSGICYGLPRKDAGGNTQLLGIICQGAAVSKACFWDNVDASSGVRIVGAATAGMDPADIEDGYTLKVSDDQQCTQCHRGDNAFIIYPETKLYQPNTDVKQTYVPIVQSGWVTNPLRDYSLSVDKAGKAGKTGDMDAGTSGCSACHALPQVTAGYCGMLQSVLEAKIMPADDNITKPESYWSVYGDDITTLASQCKFSFSKSDFEKLWGPQKAS